MFDRSMIHRKMPDAKLAFCDVLIITSRMKPDHEDWGGAHTYDRNIER